MDDPFELVAAACLVLYAQGHEHLHLGHVSSRLADGSVAIKRSGIGLGEVTRRDVIRCDLGGRLLSTADPGFRLHGETELHLAVYRRRPEVEAVVHTHPLHAAALVASDGSFRYVSQDSLPFVDGVGFHDDPRLVTTVERGERFADALGTRSAALLRNHGIAVVGSDVATAVFLAVSLERSLRVQALATTYGSVVEMSDEERREIGAGLLRPERTSDAWEYLLRDARRRFGAHGSPSRGTFPRGRHDESAGPEAGALARGRQTGWG